MTNMTKLLLQSSLGTELTEDQAAVLGETPGHRGHLKRR